jgi:hypothetical protein
MNRRQFLADSMGAAILAALPADVFAQSGTPARSERWDAGQVRHLLPTVSDRRILFKASFAQPLSASPVLRIGGRSFSGRMNDTRGDFWQFHADGLEPGRRHTLSLHLSGRTLCEPWDLSTFPDPKERVTQCRVLFFSCAGGHDAFGFVPAATRNRLLRRALSFRPEAVVANGDHVYWDLIAPRGSAWLGATEEAKRIAGTFKRSAVVFGDTNEVVLTRAAGPQITPVYGTDFRSTPVFFLQDDHDYFDNDEATPELVTFPPSWFMLQLARATQRLYYPEFLPDAARPESLPWSSVGDRDLLRGLSESFGTIRFGRLVEILLYDVRRTATLAGPSAVFVDPEAEKWLHDRNASSDVTHLVHVPSNPPGWSAGKWGEWYPDVLGADNRLTVLSPKPFWQEGWLKQHDRLMASMAAMKGRRPLVISGDLHAVALGQMVRCGALDFHANPVTTVLAGPIGTGSNNWPSAFRGVGATPPAHLDVQERITPLEQHGFTLADFLPDRIVLQFFKWDVRTQHPDAIDNLQPFHTEELGRPI